MKILALEFSSPQRSVAVVSSAECREESVEGGAQPVRSHRARDAGVSEVIETGGRGAAALGMVESALRQAQVEREQIECLAIGLGPGSYTGIRLAIALAQGWQLAAGSVRLRGISSTDCLVAQAQAEGVIGPVATIIDAQRGEFYMAGYEISGQSWRETSPLRLATQSEVEARAQAGDLLIGPEVSKWFANGRAVFPRAATLGRLALTANDFHLAEALQPIYLRETKFVKAPKPQGQKIKSE